MYSIKRLVEIQIEKDGSTCFTIRYLVTNSPSDWSDESVWILQLLQKDTAVQGCACRNTRLWNVDRNVGRLHLSDIRRRNYIWIGTVPSRNASGKKGSTQEEHTDCIDYVCACWKRTGYRQS